MKKPNNPLKVLNDSQRPEALDYVYGYGPGWMPCAYRKPDVGVQVMVCTNGGLKTTGVLESFDGYIITEQMVNGSFDPLCDVPIAWSYMPRNFTKIHIPEYDEYIDKYVKWWSENLDFSRHFLQRL